MTDTKTSLLDVAEALTQTKGFNGFSYLDLSAAVGVSTSSIHYHFKTKADLGLAMVERTRDTHMSNLKDMNRSMSDPQSRLKALVDVFKGYVSEDKFCLCGMLSAELHSVSPAVKSALNSYFKDLRIWVADQFKEMGLNEEKSRALGFVSALEGSILLARLKNDPRLVSEALSSIYTA